MTNLCELVFMFTLQAVIMLQKGAKTSQEYKVSQIIVVANNVCKSIGAEGQT